MKVAIAFVLLGITAAYADGDRCQRGIELAKQGDLPRAALYLDACTDDDGVRVRNDVTRKLEDTKLSHMTIVSMPEGAAGETDAMPGETFTTPVTIWAKAGTYKITVGGQTVEKVLEPHSRTTVIINAPPPPKPAKSGVVSFEEDPEQHQGAPPAVKHGTMMPDRYLRRGAPAGDPIDDPFARGSDGSVRWRVGVRLGAGVTDRTHAGASSSFGVAALASRPLAGPLRLTARLDWSHRAVDSIGANAGVAFVALPRAAYVLSVGAALRGDVRVQSTLDAMEVSRAGVGGAAELDLAVRSLPVGFGLRFEQGFTELVPGVRERALLVELGYDSR